MTKRAYFWAKMAIFGPKILIFSGRGKTFGTHLSTSFALFYWLGIASKWPQRPIFARFWAKNPLWGGRSKIYPHIGEPIRHLFCVKNSKRQGFQKTTPKNSISEVRIVCWGSSRILAIFWEWRDRRITTLNFGQRSHAILQFPKIINGD